MMDKEKHEELLTELLSPELEQSRRTEILGMLRTDYNDVHVQHAELTSVKEDLTKKHDDLIVANSQLFRQAGIVGDSEKEEEVEKKEFSETVTITELERNALY